MPCTPSLKPPIPSPPSFGVTVPPVPHQPNLPGYCCTILPFVTPPAPPAIPAVFATPGVVQTIRGVLKQVQAYLDAIPLDCPKE